MASLFVIQGADQGKRFTLSPKILTLGRDADSSIRLHDSEVSRKHAEIRPLDAASYKIVDLGSANGTYINGQPVDQAILRGGDHVRLGRTVLLYNASPEVGSRDLTERVDLLSHARSSDRSAILKSIPVSDASRVLDSPGTAGQWLQVRLANLSVMYRAIQAISHIVDLDTLLPRILELVIESINADRVAILLENQAGALEPRAVKWQGEADADERMTISQSIVDHVRDQGHGVISSDAPSDKRFGPAQSIVNFGIREAICVPVQGRHSSLGVLYADIRSTLDFFEDDAPAPKPTPSRFTHDHLMLMVAIGHQAGLAIENTQLYQAKLQSERLAAVGQTIATLSHHIKNILQGLRGGSYLIDMGLKQKDEAIIHRGWSILEKNQAKIYNLVMDMLSFSKDREPALEPADLNEIVSDVIELMQSRANELGVELEWIPSDSVPDMSLDPDGIHRAVLNIVTNAIDAAEISGKDGKVLVETSLSADETLSQIRVTDNGPGIPPEEIPQIFQVFSSSKGTRGTGLGLSVSQKIVQEHGGQIHVQSAPGRGSTFTIELPARRDGADHEESSDHPTLS